MFLSVAAVDNCDGDRKNKNNEDIEQVFQIQLFFQLRHIRKSP